MTSPSTLIRRARKAKTKAEAKKLREEAAQLRRALRAKTKRPAPERVAEPLLARQARATGTTAIGADPNANLVEGHAANQVYAGERAMAMPPPNPPLVAPSHADRLLTLARRKGMSAEKMQDELLAIARSVRYQTQTEAEATLTTALRHAHEVNRLNVVCAFLAQVEAMASANGGPMPDAVVVSGYTVARLVDVLKDHGFTARGKQSMGRQQAVRDMVMGQRHNS